MKEGVLKSSDRFNNQNGSVEFNGVNSHIRLDIDSFNSLDV